MVMAHPHKRNFLVQGARATAPDQKRRAANPSVDRVTARSAGPESPKAKRQSPKLQYEPLPGESGELEPISHFDEAYEAIMAARKALAEDGDESFTQVTDESFWSYSDYDL